MLTEKEQPEKEAPTESTADAPTRHKNIHEAIAAVMAEVGGVALYKLAKRVP